MAVGTGRNLPHYPTGVTVTGIDLSPAMLTIARARAAELGVVAELRVGDAHALPFGDGAFDTVVCALSLCAIPDLATAIAEMNRVLITGGRLLLIDHVGSTWPPIYAAQWLVERVTIRTAGEHYTCRQLPLVRAAGFDIVETRRAKAGVVERILAHKPTTSRASSAVGAEVALFGACETNWTTRTRVAESVTTTPATTTRVGRPSVGRLRTRHTNQLDGGSEPRDPPVGMGPCIGTAPRPSHAAGKSAVGQIERRRVRRAAAVNRSRSTADVTSYRRLSGTARTKCCRWRAGRAGRLRPRGEEPVGAPPL